MTDDSALKRQLLLGNCSNIRAHRPAACSSAVGSNCAALLLTGPDHLTPPSPRFKVLQAGTGSCSPASETRTGASSLLCPKHHLQPLLRPLSLAELPPHRPRREKLPSCPSCTQQRCWPTRRIGTQPCRVLCRTARSPLLLSSLPPPPLLCIARGADTLLRGAAIIAQLRSTTTSLSPACLLFERLSRDVLTLD